MKQEPPVDKEEMGKRIAAKDSTERKLQDISALLMLGGPTTACDQDTAPS